MKITDALLKQIYAQGRDSYPRECFGFLVGTMDDDGSVRRVVPGTNLNTERNDRFDMDPAEYMKTDREARESGYEIIGLYHTHPDWPAIPSQTDISFEVDGLYYIVVSMHNWRPLSTNVWMISDDDPRRFVPLPLEIVDERVWAEK